MTLFESLREIVLAKRVVSAPITLSESASTSRCKPISLTDPEKNRQVFAVRPTTDDWLPMLAELPKEQSIRKLPDYLVFLEGDQQLPRVLIAELKSGEKGGAAAIKQIQLGAVIVDYLLRLAWHHAGFASKQFPTDQKKESLWVCGLVVTETLPPSIGTPKGLTKPGHVELPRHRDGLSGVDIHHTGGGKNLRFSQFFD